jgi:CRISPR-associated protein Cmr2
MSQYLLMFSLGPVQQFIAAARTTRDLWTGSFLLSWLTAHAARQVLLAHGEFLSPAMAQNPLLQCLSHDCGRDDDPIDRILTPTIPNTFTAMVDNADVAERCRNAVIEEWRTIASAVHAELDRQWQGRFAGWDFRWQEQIDHFWDIRLHTHPISEHDVDTARRLLRSDASHPLQAGRQLIAAVAAADRLIRHYPAHETAGPAGDDHRPKCSMFGSMAQMGPLPSARQFWQQVAQTQINGTRLGARDRLCAVALVKRFAWSAYLARRLALDPAHVRFPDVDTVCAAEWLARSPHLGEYSRKSNWSGHWLRWRTREEAADQENPPDPQTWSAIRQAVCEAGQPPAYYAILAMDGDRIGQLLRHAPQHGAISQSLERYAQAAAPLVQQYHGRLVYAGGDDLLALLPTACAVDCCSRLATEFGELLPQRPTMSAGLAVAHFKHDLRLVLEAARQAEQTAKAAGGNRLCLRVLRRSGEHSLVLIPWRLAPQVGALIRLFQQGLSDRWIFQLRQLLPRMGECPDMARLELERLLRRAQGVDETSASAILALWDAHAATEDPTQRATLLHACSFLARSRKDGE